MPSPPLSVIPAKAGIQTCDRIATGLIIAKPLVFPAAAKRDSYAPSSFRAKRAHASKTRNPA